LTLGAFVSLPLSAAPQLTQLELPEMGEVTNFSVSDGKIAVVTSRDQLWAFEQGNWKMLDDEASSSFRPKIGFGRVAFANTNGQFAQWENDQVIKSEQLLSPNSGILMTKNATFAVLKKEQGSKLARLENHNGSLNVVAESEEMVLSDARPVLVDFEKSTNENGGIAVLAKPDSETYPHSVLGDDEEAKALLFLGGQSLKPIATLDAPEGLVFEANELNVLNEESKSRLVSVLSGNKAGGRVAIIGYENGKLNIETQSEPLDYRRWLSPFVFNQTVYAIKSPHLAGRLAKYREENGALVSGDQLARNLTNHVYASHQMNLSAEFGDYVAIPNTGFRRLTILDKQDNVEALKYPLPVEIIHSQSDNGKAYFLLRNGTIWVLEDVPEQPKPQAVENQENSAK
jgi:hypothetical protein